MTDLLGSIIRVCTGKKTIVVQNVVPRVRLPLLIGGFVCFLFNMICAGYVINQGFDFDGRERMAMYFAGGILPILSICFAMQFAIAKYNGEDAKVPLALFFLCSCLSIGTSFLATTGSIDSKAAEQTKNSAEYRDIVDSIADTKDSIQRNKESIAFYEAKGEREGVQYAGVIDRMDTKIANLQDALSRYRTEKNMMISEGHGSSLSLFKRNEVVGKLLMGVLAFLADALIALIVYRHVRLGYELGVLNPDWRVKAKRVADPLEEISSEDYESMRNSRPKKVAHALRESSPEAESPKRVNEVVFGNVARSRKSHLEGSNFDRAGQGDKCNVVDDASSQAA